MHRCMHAYLLMFLYMHKCLSLFHVYVHACLPTDLKHDCPGTDNKRFCSTKIVFLRIVRWSCPSCPGIWRCQAHSESQKTSLQDSILEMDVCIYVVWWRGVCVCITGVHKYIRVCVCVCVFVCVRVRVRVPSPLCILCSDRTNASALAWCLPQLPLLNARLS